jgi:extradiol dioxygenase family protein
MINSGINLHELGKEFEPKAFNVKEGSADLCFIIETSLEEARKHLSSLDIKLEQDIIKRTGALGEIESIYLRDPDKNLIELSNYL